MDPFIIKILVSFLVGCIWITAITLIAERFGGSVGGFIGGMPSTVVVALAFIAWTQGAQQASTVASLIPLVFATNAIFLVAYVILAGKNLVLGILGSLTVWFLIQLLVLRLETRNISLELAIWVFTSIVSIILLKFVIPVRSQKKVEIRYSPSQMLGRASFGGIVISGAIILGKFGGPALSAIFSAFPAVFLATLIITARSVNVDFSRALATPLLISAVLNCVVFALAFRGFVLHQGLLLATLKAYLVAGGSGLITAILIRLLDRIGLEEEKIPVRHHR
jgi:hypothetical protein